jgi:hypothetical protein
MSFLKILLILIATAIGFFVGGNLTQEISGAVMGAIIGFLVMLLLTKPLKKKDKPVRASLPKPQHPPQKKSTIGRIIWSILSLIGVSGMIAILAYREDQKDRERNRRQWAEQQYHQQEQQLRDQVSASMAGFIYDRQTNTPLGNAAIGYMSSQRFTELARTAPNGAFRIEMPFLPQDHFPIQIVVIAPNSRGAVYYTDKYLQYAQQIQNVNIYVINQARY